MSRGGDEAARPGVAEPPGEFSGPPVAGGGVKVVRLRRDDTCVSCCVALAAGDRAAWCRDQRVVRCLECVGGTPPPVEALPLRPRRAEESSRREHAPTAEGRSTGIRAKHPRIGGLILVFTGRPASTRTRKRRPRGDQAVAAVIDALAPEHLLALHDRRLRDGDGQLTKATIDHITVAATGVWVIDATTHKGQLEVRRSGGMFSPRQERLVMRGRDRTDLVLGLATQVAAVRAQLQMVGLATPVYGALCLVGTGLPWFVESIGDMPLVGRRGLAKLLARPGPLTPEQRQAVARLLDERFPGR